MLTSVRTDGVGQAFSLPSRPPTIGCTRCTSKPAPIEARRSGCSLHAVRSRVHRFGKSVAESKLRLPTSSMSRRQAAALRPACLACLPACLLALSQISPAPRPQTTPQVCKCGLGSMATGKQYITTPCPCSCSLAHPSIHRAQGPQQQHCPGERSKDVGDPTAHPGPSIVQSNKLQNLPSFFSMQTPPYI
jgi:hypothetical protein